MLPISANTVKHYQFSIIFYYPRRLFCWALILLQPKILWMEAKAVSQLGSLG
jgi:hypothetical protein